VDVDRLLTAEDLLRMPEDDLWHELVAGRPITMPPGGPSRCITPGRSR
jgi:hypothetical protein